MKKENLTGVRFGKLEVLRLYPYSDRHGRYWLCRCDCGKEIAVRQNFLTSGHTKSCGSAECRKKLKGSGTDYNDLVERLRNATWLPALQELMNEAADAIDQLKNKGDLTL